MYVAIHSNFYNDPGVKNEVRYFELDEHGNAPFDFEEGTGEEAPPPPGA